MCSREFNRCGFNCPVSADDVSNEYRGRVFATMESMVNSVMMVSMALAGIASQYYSPRIIAAIVAPRNTSSDMSRPGRETVEVDVADLAGIVETIVFILALKRIASYPTGAWLSRKTHSAA